MTDVRDADAPAATSQRGQSAKGHLVWYELMSPDPDGSKAFYDAVVGWNIGEPAPEFDGYRMINVEGGFAGGVNPHDHYPGPTWIAYIGVDDVDAAAASIESRGGRVLKEAWDIPTIGRVAMVSDPQGAFFYVMKPTPPAGQENQQSTVFSVDRAQHVRWNELSTTDPEGAIDFYGKQFGWSQEGDMDMGEMGKYRFIQKDGTNIGAIMPKPPQLPVSTWTFYIGVDDIDRATRAIKDGGGQVLNGPMEIPGGEFAVNAMDPQGAAFGLVGPRK